MTNNNNSIWSNAVALSLTIRTPGNRRKVDTQKVEVDADKAALYVSKELIDSPEYKAIGTLDGKVKKHLAQLALPCEIIRGGIFPIPLALVEEVSSLLSAYKAERVEAIEAFLAVYPEQAEAAKTRLRDLFNEQDYPGVHNLRGSFSVDWTYLSFETPDNLSKVSETFFQEERARAASKMQDAAAKIEAALTESLSGLVNHLAERLTPDPDGKTKRLHDSAVSKIEDFLSTFSKRNITGDDELAEVVAKAEAVIHGVDPSKIRKDGEAKNHLLGQMETIKGSLDSLISKKRRAISFEDVD